MLEKEKNLGLYLHIPFCKRKCNYCDFLSAKVDKETRKIYLRALKKEIKSYQKLAQNYQVSTIFFGGGTPSILEGEEIAEILETIKQIFSLPKTAIEQTIEINPGTIDLKKLEIYQQIGINRLSIGLQSTNNIELKKLGRIHTYEEFLENYQVAREAGFQNINIDLISAIPGQTLEKWTDSLKRVVYLDPNHISVYSLIIEEGTPFYQRYKSEKNILEKERLPSEETECKMDQITQQILKENNYIQYEISNYAKEGYQCKHNISYWKRENYLGLGLGASSLIENNRFKNTILLTNYLESSSDNKKIREEQIVLTKRQQIEEFMFLGLRMCEGINKIDFQNCFGIEIEKIYGEILEKLKKQNLLVSNQQRVYLTNKGLQLSNYVMSEFLFD